MFMIPKFSVLRVHIKSLGIVAMAAWPSVADCRGQEVILASPSFILPQANSHPSPILGSIGPTINSNGTVTSDGTVTSNRAIISNGLARWGDDVLNCEECRRRLGLPSLTVSQTVQQASQPDLVSSSVGLSGLPLEARQKLMQELSLPPGATILSAKFIEPSNQAAQSSYDKTNLTDNTTAAPAVPKVTVPKVTVPKVTVPKVTAAPQAQVIAPNLEEEVVTPAVVMAVDNPVANADSNTETQPALEPALPVSPSQPESVAIEEVSETLVKPSETTSPDALENDSSSATASPSDVKNDPAMTNLDSMVMDPAISESAEPATDSIPTLMLPEADPVADDASPVIDDVPVAEAIAVENETVRAPVRATDAKSLVVDGVLRSPALQQIQIDFLKKQLLERDDLIRQLNGMQAQFQKQIDTLAHVNDQLSKREQEMTREVQQTKVESQKVSQKQEVEVLSIRNEIASVRQQAREEAMLLNDKFGEFNKTKVEETTQLREELNAVRQSKIDSIASVRADMASVAELAAKQDTQRIADQELMIETQIKSIAKLKSQVESIQSSQALDARRIEKLRSELTIANEARLKALEGSESKSTQTDVVAEIYLAPANPILSESIPKAMVESSEDKPKIFQAPVPDIKSIKPKIPRTDNRTLNRTNTKSF